MATYIQDKENTVWKATLNIANSANGEKILYDIVPIKKVEGSVTSTTSTNNGIRQNTQKSQGKISDSEKIFSERNTGENAKFFAQGTEAKGKKFSDSQQITDDTEQAQYLNIYDYSKSLAVSDDRC